MSLDLAVQMLRPSQSNDVKRQYEVYMFNARQLVKRNAMVRMAKVIRDQAIKDQDQSRSIAIKNKFNEYEKRERTEPMHRPTTKPYLNHEVLDFINQEAHDPEMTLVAKIEELARKSIEEAPGRDALEVRDDIGKEAEKLAEIMDVIDELNIINSILEEQYEMARWSMRHNDVRDFVRDVRPSFRALLKESERVRRSVSAISLPWLMDELVRLTSEEDC